MTRYIQHRSGIFPCDLIQLLIGQVHGRHPWAWFDRIGILNPQAKICRRVGRRSRRDRVAAHEVPQIRPKASVRHGPLDRVTVNTCGALEHRRPSIASGLMAASA